MKSIYNEIANKIKKALNELNYDIDSITINESNRRDLGEFQFNGIMPLAKIYHKNPVEIANQVVIKLKEDDYFKDINVAGPGFINMTVSDSVLINFVNDFNSSYEKNNKLIFFDYGGANVSKSLHVGHVRSANIGEALKRLSEHLGYNTISDAHLGDWGRPLGLVILELSKRYPDWVYFDPNYEGEYPELNITNETLEEIYPYASNKSKEDDSYLKEAQEMTVKLQKHTKGIYDLWQKIMEISVTDIKKVYDRLNTTFDLYKGESDAEEFIPIVVDYLESNNYLKLSEGAKVILVSEESDKLEIPPMLIIKSDGGVLYGTTELATIYDRYNNYHPDKIIYVVDKRQELHFVQAFRASKKTNIVNNDTELYFAGFGTMNGKDGKPFKTRDGGVMKLNDLLDEVKSACLNKLNINIEENRDEIAEKVAISAIKYADLLPNRESDYIFDIEKFSDLEGKTGPYILYSTVRMKSLLNKSDIDYKKLKVLGNEFDREIILTLNNLDNVLNNSFNSKSLSDVTEYLYKLTSVYNRFYSEINILKEEDINKKESWLYLTNLVYEINKMLLNILAIELPEKM